MCLSIQIMGTNRNRRRWGFWAHIGENPAALLWIQSSSMPSASSCKPRLTSSGLDRSSVVIGSLFFLCQRIVVRLNSLSCCRMNFERTKPPPWYESTPHKCLKHLVPYCISGNSLKHPRISHRGLCGNAGRRLLTQLGHFCVEPDERWMAFAGRRSVLANN